MTATKGLGTTGNAAGTVTPLDHKMAHLGLIAKSAANTIRAGVFWDGNATIVSGKANMSYDVRAFAAVLSRGATAGAVLLTNDGTYNVATTAAPGSNSRYDVVYLWQREYSLDGTDSNPVIGVVQGTAAASPTVPSLAAYPGAIELARILVPSGVTATNSGTTITQTAPFTTADGGILPFRSTTEMNLFTPFGATQKAVDISTGFEYRWVSSAWKLWNTHGVQSYTPTLTGFGLTSTTVTGSYQVINGLVVGDISVALGASTTMSSGPTASLPSGLAIPAAYASDAVLGRAFLLVGGNNYMGITVRSTSSAVIVYVENASSTYAGVSNLVPASVPAAWGNGAVWRAHFEYYT